MEYILLGRDNTIDLLLLKEGPDDSSPVAVDLENATKITASFGDDLVSSVDPANGVITWDQVGYDTGEIRLALGEETLTAGTYQVPIIVYDAVNDDGIQWRKVDMKVVADEEGSV